MDSSIASASQDIFASKQPCKNFKSLNDIKQILEISRSYYDLFEGLNIEQSAIHAISR